VPVRGNLGYLVLPIIAVLPLVSVEYGCWALLGLLTGRDKIGEFRERFFCAGHAHARMLLVVSLIYFLYLDRTGYSTGAQRLAGMLLLLGILAQSGGFFVHVWLGQPARSSPGLIVTGAGAVLLAAALLISVICLIF
jgi:hypothetical protein